MEESLMQRIMRQQRARDQSDGRAPPAAAAPPTPPAATSPAASAANFASNARPQPERQQETTAAIGTSERITALLQARAAATTAAPREPDEVDDMMALIKAKRLREPQGNRPSGQEAAQLAPLQPPAKPPAQAQRVGMGAANTSDGKHVNWSDFKKHRAGHTGTATRRAPARDDSEDESDQELDDDGTAMGPMGDAPIDRWSAENRKAAAKFLEKLGSVECARRHFKDQAIAGTASDHEDYLMSIAASSHGYITLCMGRAIKLEKYLGTRDDNSPLGSTGMYIHGHVNSRAMIGFLNEEAKNGRTARQGAEAQTRKLKTWGFDFVVDSEANANARKAAPKPTKRDAKPANPFDLDMAAHIGFGVADTTLNPTQRGCYAQIEIMQQGVLRHVNANRCGEITDCKEGERGVNPDFLIGRVALDAKKAQDKRYDKPFCAVKRTFTGYEYGPVLLQSLQGVTHLGFLIRDLSAASANPFEEGCTFINTPMDRNRTLRMIGHLLRHEVTYPDGSKQRPGYLERLEHLGVQAARHVLPAAAGARFESRRAIREIGIWSKSTAEDTTVPGMGRLADLVTTAWGADPDEDGTAHTTPDQYASHGTMAALPSIILRQHRAISALIQEHAADLTAIAGSKGWKLLHQAAWPTGFQRTTAVSGAIVATGGQPAATALTRATATVLAAPAAAAAMPIAINATPLPAAPTGAAGGTWSSIIAAATAAAAAATAHIAGAASAVAKGAAPPSPP